MTSGPLSGQRVLVTRPIHQAEALCQRLQALGAEPVRFPTLAIEPLDENGPLKQRFLDLDLYFAVIFVSANAARLGHEWIDSYWPQLPIKVLWLAVGDATAAVLEARGVPTRRPAEGMDSEALLALPELQQLDHSRILICRGEGGRELLAQTLSARGAKVDYAELYRRRCPTYKAADVESIIYKSPPSVMLVSSAEALENLVQLGSGFDGALQRLQQRPLIVPSARVAARARQLGFSQVRLAANATDQAMVAALQVRDSTAF